MGSSEQRTERRAPVVLRIKLRYQSVDNFIEKFATNISRGGMFISSRKPKPPGSEVRFELRLADDSAIIAGKGIVRWIRDFDPENPRRMHGMGIEFTEVDERSSELLDRIVAHKRHLGLPDDDDIPLSRRGQAGGSTGATAPVKRGEARESGDQPKPAAETVSADATETRSPEPESEPRPPAEPTDSAAPASAPSTRKRLSPAELMAQVAAAPARADDPDLAALLDSQGALPDLERTLARARELAHVGESADSELDALLKVSATPTARSARDATEQLAAMLGISAPAPRRRVRTSDATAGVATIPAPAPTTEPVLMMDGAAALDPLSDASPGVSATPLIDAMPVHTAPSASDELFEVAPVASERELAPEPEPEPEPGESVSGASGTCCHTSLKRTG